MFVSHPKKERDGDARCSCAYFGEQRPLLRILNTRVLRKPWVGIGDPPACATVDTFFISAESASASALCVP
ncbi:hypothetical protein HanXRQr2_Chr14g0621211 [Helianthus annuus]|uniref:Uncharacterized protein n=1 Tax=Helianthus annuus TaxID=4232 RepID=A0A9K3E531_HELAN|nr:hypothetical protein HanXRQr2_Chr14g0621211 [Helianthus annuus]KAJ0462773.1 hypothetical protein HanHA300_Chr14g0507841 [Helianthus annuus]KAJ0466443.1 hypothetical protein HanIR_Chr14g0672231 [Helianthus annuus]KAJ0484108.1 hypothetical protein HanHA89_Chr14g0540501 [Helianthus annuus]KAJ0654689.1 hypothetical protein HanLR1_Chr14g0510001 [Helianthus annuus]